MAQIDTGTRGGFPWSLIKAKRAAGRPRDFDHLPELEALLELRRKRPSVAD